MEEEKICRVTIKERLDDFLFGLRGEWETWNRKRERDAKICLAFRVVLGVSCETRGIYKKSSARSGNRRETLLETLESIENDFPWVEKCQRQRELVVLLSCNF